MVKKIESLFAAGNISGHNKSNNENRDETNLPTFIAVDDDKYRALFEATPISLWDEDFSDIKQHIDRLKAEGVSDFRAYFDQHPEDVYRCIGMVKVVDVNQTTLRMYKADNKTHLLENLETIFGPDAFGIFKEELIIISKGGTHFESAGTNYSLDGKKLDVYVRWSVPPGYEESLERVIVSITDVTIQKRAARQLRLQAAALESAPNAIVITDTTGAIKWVNPAFTKLTGYAYNEVLDKNPRILKSGLNNLAFYENLWRTILSGQVWHGHELVNRRKDGTFYHEKMTISPVKDEKGQITNFIAIKEDISQQKESEIALQAAKEYAERLFRVVPSAIITVDLNCRITSWNQKAEELFGYTEAEIIGQSCKKFAMSSCAERCGLYLADVPKPITGLECKAMTKDGRDITIVKNVDLLHDGAGNVIGGIESFEDITERKQLEMKLRRQFQEEELLRQVMALTVSGSDLTETITQICQKLAQFYSVPKSAFALINEDQTQAEVIAEYREPEQPSSMGTIIPVENNESMAYLMTYKSALAIDDVQTDPIMGPARPILQQLGIVSMMLVPILSGENIVGTMGFDAVERKVFTVEEIDLAHRVAMHIGQALKRKQLETQLRRRVKEEALLREISDLTVSPATLQEMLSRVCEMMAQFYDVPSSSFSLVDDGSIHVDVIADYKSPDLDDLEKFIVPLMTIISVDQVFSIKATHAIENIFDDPLLEPVFDICREFDNVSSLFTPIVIGDSLHGILEFNSHQPRKYSKQDIELGEKVAVLINQAIQYEKSRRDLQEQRDFAQQVVDNMGQGLVVVNTQWTIEFANQSFADLLGYTVDQLTGISSLDLVHNVKPKIVEQVYAQWISGQTQSRELPLQRANGSLVFVLLTAVPRYRNGIVDGAIAVVTDLTARKQMEQAVAKARDQAVEASRLKSEFLANMSHEIRTPLNAVIGMTSLMMDTTLTNEQRDYAQTIRSSGDVLLSLINDILDFSKIEAGKLEMEKRPFDLRDCVEAALDVVVKKASEKNLEMAYIIDDGVPHAIQGDVTRLRQIFVNLLNNAIKFTESGEVVLSVSRLPSLEADADSDSLTLQFSVQDTGIGIPKKRLDRLFKSFSQVDASTTRKYGGTGLGLAICKRLVEMMGGQIWVESDLNVGSIFHFTIQTSAVHRRRRVYARKNQPRLSGKRLLIVDDNETNRRILLKQSKLWGMKPHAVNSGPSALAELKTGKPYDLAILDMHMPEMDGMMLAAEIRKKFDKKALPLVMLSSIGDQENLREPSYFSAYLTKPVKQQQLYEALCGLFDEAVVLPKRLPEKQAFDPEMGVKHPLRILLAEDNLVNQKVALRILERMGYRADVAANGMEVLESLQRQFYDVVLMDVQMPHMDGVTATQQIREIWPAGRQPQIVAMTANALTGDKEKYLDAGMDFYISKPVRIQELVAVLQKCKSL